MGFVTIDFEASCLPKHGRSFPIEVAISGPEGTRSWLIKPDPFWRDWDWTEEAARLHGIGRETLERDGRAPAVVAKELTEAIAGRRVIADSNIDAVWWATLAAAARHSGPCRIEHVGPFLDELGVTAEEIAAAMKFADGLSQSRHRAGPDAQWLRCLLSRAEWIVATRAAFSEAA